MHPKTQARTTSVKGHQGDTLLIQGKKVRSVKFLVRNQYFTCVQDMDKNHILDCFLGGGEKAFLHIDCHLNWKCLGSLLQSFIFFFSQYFFRSQRRRIVLEKIKFLAWYCVYFDVTLLHQYLCLYCVFSAVFYPCKMRACPKQAIMECRCTFSYSNQIWEIEYSIT